MFNIVQFCVSILLKLFNDYLNINNKVHVAQSIRSMLWTCINIYILQCGCVYTAIVLEYVLQQCIGKYTSPSIHLHPLAILTTLNRQNQYLVLLPQPQEAYFQQLTNPMSILPLQLYKEMYITYMFKCIEHTLKLYININTIILNR